MVTMVSKLDTDSSLNLNHVLLVYVSPVILILGVTGNTLVIILFGLRGSLVFRKCSIAVYLLVMAVGDLIFLVAGRCFHIIKIYEMSKIIVRY